MKRPNILLLYVDQMRWDALGCNGNPDIHTPHLDRLAQDGLNFDHFFVQNPVCMPSRVSFLSGQYPGTLGITHMGVPVPEELPLLPHLLSPYGYRTANIGKLHFLPHSNRDHRRPHPPYGFGHLEISDEPGCYEDAYSHWVRRKAPEELGNISCGLPPAREVWQATMGEADSMFHPPAGRQEHVTRAFASRRDLTHTAFVGEQTREFLRGCNGQPFFCIAGFYSPHSPWIAPREFLDLYDPPRLALPATPAGWSNPHSEAHLRQARHGYYAMITEVDHHVGLILEELTAQNLEEETIVVFTSDHGEWLGEHGLFGKSYPGHDAVSRVPCLVRWPQGIREAGRTVTDIVEAVDFLPTVLDAAAIPRPPWLQGRSLLPHMSSRTPNAAAQWQSGPAGTQTGGDGNDEPQSALMEGLDWKSLRTPRFRYVCHAGGEEKLFALDCEFGEYTDVAALPEYHDDLAALRRALLCRLLQRERPLPRTWVY